MLEMDSRDGTEFVSNTLIQSLHRVRRQWLLFFDYRSIHRLDKREVAGCQSCFLFETHAYLTTVGKFVTLLSSCMTFCESFSLLSRLYQQTTTNDRISSIALEGSCIIADRIDRRTGFFNSLKHAQNSRFYAPLCNVQNGIVVIAN